MKGITKTRRVGFEQRDLAWFQRIYQYDRWNPYTHISDQFRSALNAYDTHLQEISDAEEKLTFCTTSFEFRFGDGFLPNDEVRIKGSTFIYKDYEYQFSKKWYSYPVEEVELLIFDDYDKERRLFERLKNKYAKTEKEKEDLKRPRIPESIRIKVWQRDNGNCARCGSREKLEYDHILPISKGGSNTLRNIELLCEGCNRSKSNKIGG